MMKYKMKAAATTSSIQNFTYTVTASGHCCTCSYSCVHANGPWFCIEHARKWCDLERGRLDDLVKSEWESELFQLIKDVRDIVGKKKTRKKKA